MQPSNIRIIFVTLEVLKQDRSRLVKLWQLENILAMFVTLEVSKLPPKLIAFRLTNDANIWEAFGFGAIVPSAATYRELPLTHARTLPSPAFDISHASSGALLRLLRKVT